MASMSSHSSTLAGNTAAEPTIQAAVQALDVEDHTQSPIVALPPEVQGMIVSHVSVAPATWKGRGFE